MIAPTFILNVHTGVIHKAYDNSFTAESCNVDDIAEKATASSVDELKLKYGERLKFCRRCFRKALEVPV